jgi:uncharacterized protein (TIGR03083 family)
VELVSVKRAARWHSVYVEESRFADCLADDYTLLRDAAASVDLDVPVPSCPGWTMGDLIYHVAEVYLHKVTVMRTGEWPRPWPPPPLAAEPRLALLGRAYGALTAEFGARDSAEPTPTWYEMDETVAFWLRRMAQETVIHRIDAELAAGLAATRVPDDLALDGIDEVLTRFLGYRSPRDVVAHLDDTGTIVITSGGRSWTVRPSSSPSGSPSRSPSRSSEVTVEEGADYQARAEVRATPDRMLRWLWGRAGNDVVAVDGDPAWADYLRRLLTATTQ